MGMGAIDNICTGINGGTAQFRLGAVGLVVVFLAPVHDDDDDLGTFAPQGGDFVFQTFYILGLVVGVNTQGQAAVGGEDHGVPLVNVVQSGGIQGGNGIIVTLLAVVHGMVVHHIGEFHIANSHDLGVFHRAFEYELLGSGGVGICQGTLQIDEGTVIGGEILLYIGERIGVVVTHGADEVAAGAPALQVC